MKVKVEFAKDGFSARAKQYFQRDSPVRKLKEKAGFRVFFRMMLSDVSRSDKIEPIPSSYEELFGGFTQKFGFEYFMSKPLARAWADYFENVLQLKMDSREQVQSGLKTVKEMPRSDSLFDLVMQRFSFATLFAKAGYADKPGRLLSSTSNEISRTTSDGELIGYGPTEVPWGSCGDVENVPAQPIYGTKTTVCTETICEFERVSGWQRREEAFGALQELGFLALPAAMRFAKQSQSIDCALAGRLMRYAAFLSLQSSPYSKRIKALERAIVKKSDGKIDYDFQPRSDPFKEVSTDTSTVP